MRNRSLPIRRSKEGNSALKLVFFLLSPFFSFLYSLKSMGTRSSFVVFFLFALCFGMAFTVEGGKSDQMTIDGAAYRQKFELYTLTGDYAYYQDLKEYLQFDEGSKDFYFDTVAYWVSRFTDNYHVLFLVLAIPFAIFSLLSFRYLVREPEFDNSWMCLFLAYLFMFNSIFNINGVRFWTAAWIAVFCIFKIFRDRKNQYLLLALCTPFVHGTFWFFIGIVLLAWFTRRFERFWIVMLVISFFLSNIFLQLVLDLTDFLPPFLARFVNHYTDESYIEMRNSGSGFWFVSVFFNYLVSIYLFVFTWLLVRRRHLVKADVRTRSLYLFLLVWLTFTNLSMSIPSLGNRYVILGYPILAYLGLIHLKNTRSRWIIKILPFVFLMQLYLQYQYYTMVLAPDFYVSSPFYLAYKYLIA